MCAMSNHRRITELMNSMKIRGITVATDSSTKSSFVQILYIDVFDGEVIVAQLLGAAGCHKLQLTSVGGRDALPCRVFLRGHELLAFASTTGKIKCHL